MPDQRRRDVPGLQLEAGLAVWGLIFRCKACQGDLPPPCSALSSSVVPLFPVFTDARVGITNQTRPNDS